MPALAGVEMATAASGTKYQGRDDVCLMRFAPGTQVAGVLTTNSLPGEPVRWARQILPHGQAAALLVNAGVANVLTGKAGMQAQAQLVAQLAGRLKVPREHIYTGSTGVIGEPLQADVVVDHLEEMVAALGTGTWEGAATAIGTTDTFAKGATQQVQVHGKTITLCGIIKGSGMIAPDMATMLGYVVTDAPVPAPILQHWLDAALPHSYHGITVDSDTSTSDMVLCFATGQASVPAPTEPEDPAWQDFARAFAVLHHDLAMLVLRDGEGVSRLIHVQITGAKTEHAARRMARSVADSPLVKCMVAGADPNWGRLAMAVGKTGEAADRDRLAIHIGPHPVVMRGEVVEGYDEAPVASYMHASKTVVLKVDVGVGEGEAQMWGNDLTEAYLRINVDYRS